jgi:hypothetical protein
MAGIDTLVLLDKSVAMSEQKIDHKHFSSPMEEQYSTWLNGRKR